MSFLFDKVKGAINDISGSASGNASAAGLEQPQPKRRPGERFHCHSSDNRVCSHPENHHTHRFQSFAPQRAGNEVKWYVDGCSYMYAVSVALEQARESIWILDWWLSPELYLRRPPAKNEQYRLDKMLFNAAHRGVQVNIIVYKEVTQALTLSSHHTKHWLEDRDPTGNIKVFRHPDHLPDRQTMASNMWNNIKQTGLNAAKLSQLPGDFIKGVYGMSGDTILYWAHHEKLCVVDGRIGFMGGLDLCYGRWDTNQHPIADFHPNDLNEIVFPGCDYNNARIMDFADVSNWEQNKLDRRRNCRMGWSDVALCMRGPIVEDMKSHFAQRWNMIYFEKYDVRQDERYHPIDQPTSKAGIIGPPYEMGQDGVLRGEGQYENFRERMHQQLEKARSVIENRQKLSYHRFPEQEYPPGQLGGMNVQLMRSCAKWSHSTFVEHSIANAYIQTIANSQHFVYIENQFFITATGTAQYPVRNRIGAALVERIVRAARNGEPYHVIVNIPAVPGFAGDLKIDDSLGTRAIMEFQYDSICRGGNSIMEKIAEAGVDPMQYIRFYNLRNYDRIRNDSDGRSAQRETSTNYDNVGLGLDQRSRGGDEYNASREMSQQGDSARPRGGGHGWDTVSSCYMLGGEDIRNVPWDGDAESELDAFVSEQLYIHSKLLIADDRVVICGSANLNDRSQLGPHDSEIAVLIEDQEEIESRMAGRPWRATKFAAGLRRHLFRKHIGLLPPQDMEREDANYLPVGFDTNLYDWDSQEDYAVVDPVDESFLNLWNRTAATNTEMFRKVFHPVPDDTVKNWKDYENFYTKYCPPPSPKDKDGVQIQKLGHVVREEFSPGEEGLREVKECLSRIRGTLVEMPLTFLQEEDIAKEGIGLNKLTEEVYT
ncbi:phospholipase D/nuclease [Piedraia hortae CBS 480.64]|uniref:Phospholipase n=1 Tax=Piedraia hortae CBS 480.64 TaxID=1314780 RepID=A0A6A7C6Z2_9PEZI|nr:phospholipase D/nuclease [Piedraia hortae CBS 480.64]